MSNTCVLSNSLSSHLLTLLRDKTTGIEAFRNASDRLSYILISHACQNLQTEEREVQTPFTMSKGKTLSKKIVFIPILRAGLSMLPQSIALIPSAVIGMVGIKRDEQKATPIEYYKNLPNLDKSHVLILDPMLATGGSSITVLDYIYGEKPLSVQLITVICAPEGIESVHAKFPDVSIYTASIDDGLDDKKFIVPGLGDFGDRYFGTT